MTVPAVAHTAEFQRITSLPRRVWSAEDLASLTASLTEILRAPGGSMTLRPVQALALYEAGVEGGLFGPIDVGDGKTLMSLMLPIVCNAQRPLLLLPANLIENAKRAQRLLAADWKIPNTLRIMSTNILGCVQSADELDNYQPDLIVVDEAQRLKNKRAAVTRRVARYMINFPLTKFAALSGTIMDKSITEFAHILVWCLKLRAPVPVSTQEVEEWAEALDEESSNRFDLFSRRAPGALLELCTPEELASNPPHIAARLGFQRRLLETPGVVASTTVGGSQHVGCSIYVRGIMQKVAPVTERNFLKLRGNGTEENPGWLMPNELPLDMAVDVWRHAQELALGLHYEWDPPPPDAWRYARREWHSFAREIISRGRTYDSELHVANACDAGRLDGSKLQSWRAIRDTYTANVVPVWHDSSAIETCAEWMNKPGIVWTEHGFFAEALAKHTGAPYFGAKGYSAAGLYIEDAAPGTSVIASIDANREGRNLQGLWSRNLMVCPPSSPGWWEQTIGRTHRPGQKADEVTVDVLLGCRENFDACMKALEGAKAVRDMTGKQQKLLLADVTLPSEWEIDSMHSPRWTR